MIPLSLTSFEHKKQTSLSLASIILKVKHLRLSPTHHCELGQALIVLEALPSEHHIYRLYCSSTLNCRAHGQDHKARQENPFPVSTHLSLAYGALQTDSAPQVFAGSCCGCLLFDAAKSGTAQNSPHRSGYTLSKTYSNTKTPL